jgi:hypothetical protein
MTSLQPVAVMKISPLSDADRIGATEKPSSFAFNAAIGSTSVTITFAPIPDAFLAIPFPTCPYPATTTFFPETSMFVARIMPSKADWPVP